MKKITVLLFVLVVAISQSSYSQYSMKFGQRPDGLFDHKIDSELSMCLDDSTTVIGDCNCYQESYKAWQGEIDKYYNILVKNLPNGNIKDGVVSSHKIWIQYRDAEYESSYAFYRDFNTSRIQIYNYHIRIVDLNRKRALELKLYCDNLNLN